MNTKTNTTENHFFSSEGKKMDIKGKLIVGTTQLAVALIIAILFLLTSSKI